ncbi:carbohydrate esterase family 16 protein [Mycena galericulata]|nr:carbohydrate esterase family 16 protein [Mycena galericulata]
MFPLLASSVLAFLCTSAYAVVLPAVKLAVSPQCGTLSSGVPADVNVGLGPLSSYKTIVAFGDSYTGGGNTNGPTWVQDLATTAGATLINYASSGAVVDVDQWPQIASVQTTASVDFINQANNFMQSARPDPSTTLYIVFFGIGDYAEAIATGDTSLEQIAEVLVYVSQFSARQIVDNYGLGKTSPEGNAFKQDLYESLETGHTRYGWNVGFASFNNIWEGVLYGSPGYAAFGYTNPGICNETCADPAHTFMWAPGNPSAATHSIMATYVEEVLTQCKSST